MTSFYFCNTCKTLIAGRGATVNHSANGHSLTPVNDVGDRERFGVIRTENNSTSSANGPTPMSINNVAKRIAYIGKSGREVVSRREGSYISVKYIHIDEFSGARVDLTEQDYYKLLFSGGIPPAEYLHTFNSSQYNARRFINRMLISRNDSYAIVANGANKRGRLLFYPSSGAYYGYTEGDELSNPEGFFYKRKPYASTTNANEAEREYISNAMNHREIIYYDLLAPRADLRGEKYLTRVMLTVHYTEDAVSREIAPESRQFILYELDESEILKLKEGTSFDWPARIVQDAREVMCS